jgi:hypothetical protein
MTLSPSRRQRHLHADRDRFLADIEVAEAADIFLDADQLVVLGQPVRARQRAGLDLAAVGGDREVGDGRILGLARAVRHHRRV